MCGFEQENAWSSLEVQVYVAQASRAFYLRLGNEKWLCNVQCNLIMEMSRFNTQSLQQREQINQLTSYIDASQVQFTK